jgi:UDP:flavonoid glycosyltransferase YjiC (YdhE family)
MSDACAARGAARTVPSTRITAATIKAALRSLFADDRFRTAAQQVAREIASTPGPEDAARSLRAIARDRDDHS